MGLFHRRPLCLFCCLFITSAAIFAQLSFNIKIWMLAILMLALLVSIFLCIVLKRHRIQVIFSILCLCAVVASGFNVSHRIDMKKLEAEKYEGKHNVAMSIVSEENSSLHSVEYVVYVENIDGKQVHIKSMLVCPSENCFRIGDVVYAEAELTSHSGDGYSTSEPDILLEAVVDGSAVGLVRRFDYEASFFKRLVSRNGITVVVSQMRELISHRAVSVFGEKMGGMVEGFLIGDTSDMSIEALRDFRRSGVSHLFAVSGMHITVLIGFIELILRKLYVPKIGRMLAVCILSVFLLCVTGFSMSALRSVFMLWIAYVAFWTSDETDAPTVLFVAVSLTMLIFPYSVYELGLWMSFLATLGLVTVYPLVDSAIILPKKKGFLAWLLRILKSIAMIAAMTVIATMFLLPIQWYFFGELSLVSIPANMLLSPMSTVFMILGLVFMLLGGIPYVGAAGSALTCTVGDGMVWIAEKLSALSMATVSLRYSFVWIFVLLFTVSFLSLMVIKLKHKWIVFAPFVAFTLVLGISITVFNFTATNKFTYYKYGSSEMVSVTSGGKTGIVDMSNGAYSKFSRALSDASRYGATQLDSIVFTEITPYHISSMKYFLQRQIVKSIYIPKPTDTSDVDLSLELARLAEKCNVNVYLYENGDGISVGNVTLGAALFYDGDESRAAVFVYGKEETIGFVEAGTAAVCDSQIMNLFTPECKMLVVGGNASYENNFTYDVYDDAIVIYASEDIISKGSINAPKENIYFFDKQYSDITLSFK